METVSYSKPGVSSPVKQGERYHVKIEDIGRQGDGIARISGLIIFVPGAKVGDEMDVNIVKVVRSAAFAEKVAE